MCNAFFVYYVNKENSLRHFSLEIVVCPKKDTV